MRTSKTTQLVGQVDALMREIFGATRDPRSSAYKAGVRAVLKNHFEGETVLSQLTYPCGSAERDAFFAGCEEGRFKVRELKAKDLLSDGCIERIEEARLEGQLKRLQRKVDLLQRKGMQA